MKKLIFPLLMFGFVTAQAQVGIGTTTPDASAMLEVKSTSQGFLPPRMKSAERAAISNPANGLIVFQTDGTRGLYYYDRNQWLNLATGMPPDANGIASSALSSIVTTFAGADRAGSVDDDDPEYASFLAPGAMTKDAAGNLYVCDRDNHKIRKILMPTGWVSTVATLDALPEAVTLDVAGNFYVVSQGNYSILKISPTGTITTFAGKSTESGYVDGPGTAARFFHPTGITIDVAGNLYVSDINYVRKISPAGLVSTLATTTGTFTNAIVADNAGNVFVADYNLIKKIGHSGMVTVFAGAKSGFVDGLGTDARFGAMFGFTLDVAGNLYVTDAGRIRRITPSGLVTTLAGSGTAAYINGVGAGAAFDIPWGIVVGNDGYIYVADMNNNRIRKIYVLPGTQPE